MKIFDRWIEKQYHKRFKLDLFQPHVIETRRIETLKAMQCLMIEKEVDDLIDLETKKKELASKFSKMITDHMEIRRREEPRMHLIVYEAFLEIVPRGNDEERITFDEWRKQHEQS